MKTISPLLKGVITGLLMLGVSLIFYYTDQPADSAVLYIIYAIYAAGILWTLFAFSRTPAYTGKFGNLFNQGFRCFIIVTFIMVAFAGIFSAMHPEIGKEQAIAYREYLQKEEKNKTPAEVDSLVEGYEKQYTTRYVSLSIFGYLITGAVFAAGGSVLLLLMRRK